MPMGKRNAEFLVSFANRAWETTGARTKQLKKRKDLPTAHSDRRGRRVKNTIEVVDSK